MIDDSTATSRIDLSIVNQYDNWSGLIRLGRSYSRGAFISSPSGNFRWKGLDLEYFGFFFLHLGMYVMIVAECYNEDKETLSAIKLLDLSAFPNHELYWWLEIIDVHRQIYNSRKSLRLIKESRTALK